MSKNLFQPPNIIAMVENARSSACVLAVAGTHAPGTGEGVEVEKMVRRHRHCSQLLSWVEGGSKTMPRGGNVDGKYAPD